MQVLFRCTVAVAILAVARVPAQAAHQTLATDGVAPAQVPVYFTANEGLVPDPVKFVVLGTDKSLFFTPTGVTFALRSHDRGARESWAVRLEFLTEHDGVDPVAVGPHEAIVSHFVGPQRHWKTGLACYREIRYDEVWPGIDIVYRGTNDRLKYEFRVRPGADPSRVRLRYHGATSVDITSAGALRIETPVLSFEDAPPMAYQDRRGKRVAVSMAYSLSADGTIGFDLGDYDPDLPLVLDPAVLLYCGLIGGTNSDWGEAVATDRVGNVYVVGGSMSSGVSFPVRTGPFPTSLNQTAFIAKVDPTGTGLVYAGFIGGAGSDAAYGVAVDASGYAYVTGVTSSDEQSFPVKVGPGLTLRGSTAFVAKVSPTGKDLAYCGYLGSGLFSWGIAIDAAGAAYVTGSAMATSAPLPGPVGTDRTFNGGIVDAFVAKVNPAGTGLDYAGYIGGTSGEEGRAIAVDARGAAHVIGWTMSDETSFPVRGGPDVSFNGRMDAFVAKVAPTGTSLVYSGFIGGSADDFGWGIALDRNGDVYLCGTTESTEATFPVQVGPDLTHNGNRDGFIARLDASGATFSYCGFVGGSGPDHLFGVAVDSVGRACVAGFTTSPDLPVRNGPSPTHGGQDDALVARVTPSGRTLDYCGYIGGGGVDRSHGIAVGPTDAVYVVGHAAALTTMAFPVRTGPITTYSESTDAFVAKVGFTHLLPIGAPRLGGLVDLDLTADDSRGLVAQFGSSLGTGPIPIGRRAVALAPDALLQLSIGGSVPSVFGNYTTVVVASGRARARVAIPNLTVLAGLTIHTAAVTLDAGSPQGIRAISNSVALRITP